MNKKLLLLGVCLIIVILVAGCVGNGDGAAKASCVEGEDVKVCGNVDVTVAAGETATAVITVKNTGDSTILASIPLTEDWLDYSPTLGTEYLEAKEERDITVTVSPPAGTTPGDYHRTISFIRTGAGAMGMRVVVQLPATIHVV